MVENRKTKDQITVEDVRDGFYGLNSMLWSYIKNIADIDEKGAEKASKKISSIATEMRELGVQNSIKTAIDTFGSTVKKLSKINDLNSSDIDNKISSLVGMPKYIEQLSKIAKKTVENSKFLEDTGSSKVFGYKNTKNGSVISASQYEKLDNDNKMDYIGMTKSNKDISKMVNSAVDYVVSLESAIIRIGSIPSSEILRSKKCLDTLCKTLPGTLSLLFSSLNDVEKSAESNGYSEFLFDSPTDRDFVDVFGNEVRISTQSEEMVFLATDYISNMFSGIEKISYLDTGKLPTENQMRRGIEFIASDIKILIDTAIKEFEPIAKNSESVKENTRLLADGMGSVVEDITDMITIVVGSSDIGAKIDTAMSNIEKMDTILKGIVGFVHSASKSSKHISRYAKRSKVTKDTKDRVNQLVDIFTIPIERLGDKDISQKTKSAARTTALFVASIAAIVGVAALVATAIGRNSGDVASGTLAMGVFTVSSTSILERFSKNRDTIESGARTMLYIAGSFLLFTSSILLLGLASRQSMVSIAMFAGLVMASLVVLYAVQKITDRGYDRGSGLPNACMPLLAIAGSFIMFSMSILLLGLTNELTWQSMLGFGLIVAAALGVLYILSRFRSDVLKGSLSMLAMGAAFLVFSGVLAILSRISEDMDNVEVLGTVGVMAALIGVGILAGLAIVPLALGAGGIILLSVGMLTMSLSLLAMAAISKRIGNPDETIEPITDTIVYIVEQISDISVARLALATINAGLIMAMMTEMVVVCTMFRLVQLASPKYEDIYRIDESIRSIVSSVNGVANGLAEMSIGTISKATFVSFEAMFMLLNLSLVARLMTGIGNRRVPISWDSKGKPNEWATIDPGLISKADNIAKLLVNSVGSITDTINNYDIKDLRKAKRRVKKMRRITSCISSMLDLVVKLTDGPISYGNTDEEGNLIQGTGGTIKGNLGDYIKSHSKQIEKNVLSLIGLFDKIAEDITGEKGIGRIDEQTLRRGKRNIKVVDKVIGLLDPAIELIKSLSSGEYTIKGEVDEKGNKIGKDEKVNLGDYLNRNSANVKKNVSSIIVMLSGIAATVTKEFKEIEGSDLRKSKRKIKKVSQIVDSLNPAIELIKSLSNGEYTIPGEVDENGIKIGKDEKVNLGKYLEKQSTIVEGNIETLIKFVGKIAERAAELGREDKSNKSDLKKGSKKATLVNGVLDTITGTLELIEQLASGQIQVGTKDDGTPVMENMTEFLDKKSPDIHTNIDKLINFIIGPDGIQSYIDKLAGEKNKATEKKQNAIDLVNSMNEVVSGIIETVASLGNSLKDEVTAQLFGTDDNKNLKGQLSRLMEGYSVPLDDSQVFANEKKFKARLLNLTMYDKLMKSMISIKNVSNYEKSVKATGDMVSAINSINDTKIDKLNKLMENMTEFGQTMDDALKKVFDQVIKLTDELHYVIEATEKKQKEKSTEVTVSTTSTVSSTSTSSNIDKFKSKIGAQQGKTETQVKTQKIDISSIEGHLQDLSDMVELIKNKYVDGNGQ